MVDADTIEREIVERIKAAKLDLRFDKVVVRLVGGLKAALADVVPQGRAVVFTVAAPIRLPATTAAALENLARNCPPGGERRETIYGNPVRVRWLTGVPPRMPKALGCQSPIAFEAAFRKTASRDLKSMTALSPN
jgi:hypothetical protein